MKKVFISILFVFLFLSFNWALVPVHPFPANNSVMEYENWFAWELSSSDTASWHKYQYKFELYNDKDSLLVWDVVAHGPIKANAYRNLPPGINHPPFINPAYSNIGKIKLSQGYYKWRVGIIMKNFIVWGPWWHFQVNFSILSDHLVFNSFLYSFKLQQNYPNPFNPVTTISYQLPQASYVELTVYNISGQKVATLVSGKQNAGEYQIEFNADYLPSGTYIYRLKAGSLVQTKKMILLK